MVSKKTNNLINIIGSLLKKGENAQADFKRTPDLIAKQTETQKVPRELGASQRRLANL